MLPKYGMVLPTENSKSIRGKKNAKGTVVICVNAHLLSRTYINVNWVIQQASMLCKSSKRCCIKVCINGHSNMMELVEWGFLS